MIEIKGLGEVRVDGVALRLNPYGRGNSSGWGIDFSFGNKAGKLILGQRFSDFPQNLRELTIANVSRSSMRAEFRDDFKAERDKTGAIRVSIICTFKTKVWKHLWSIQEYMDEFRRVIQRENQFQATWSTKPWPAPLSFAILFPLENTEALIGEEALKHEKTMLKLHALTAASLESNLSRPGAERIIRSIEFPPEYHRSGITILSYFADVLRHKNLPEEVKVTIEQSGLNVTLVIETPTGQRELIERTLEAYALVVTGKRPIETLTTDPFEVAELKSQLRVAQLQLEDKRDMLALKDSEVKYLQAEIKSAKASLKRLEQRTDEDRAQLMKLIEGLVSHNTDLASGFKELTGEALKFQNKALAGALGNLYKVIERGVRQEDRDEVIESLSTIQREDSGVFQRVYDVLVAGAMSNAAGNYLYAWLQFFVGSLPK